jgi:DNA-binding NtrC family response regulator
VARAGSCESIPVDVRLIASAAPSTHDDEDLRGDLACLGAVELVIPPLRQRPEEIPAFAEFFLEQLNHRFHRDFRLCTEMIDAFRAQSWPGNIRELENAVRQAVVGAGVSVLARKH